MHLLLEELLAVSPVLTAVHEDVELRGKETVSQGLRQVRQTEGGQAD